MSTSPMTGAEYLESLRDEREVWIYGERVKDVTTHPAFRNSARMIARLYDSLHDPKNRETLTSPTADGGFTQKFFLAPTTWQEQLASRDAIAAWSRMSYGWMGRSPDYKGSFVATLQPNAAYYGKYQQNAVAWGRKAQARTLFMNHAIVHPPVDRDRPVEKRAEACVHVVKETDQGLVVSGAKIVATSAALTNVTFVAQQGQLMVQDPRYTCCFMVPMSAKGVKLICRASFEQTAAVMGTPFDYPLSSRMDENDAVFILDQALIPWEDVLIYGDLTAANTFVGASGFYPRALMHGCTRLAVKLDFICGLMIKALEAGGTYDFRGQQARAGELIGYRNLFWSLSDSMARNASRWVGGTVLPSLEATSAYHVLAPILYPRISALITESVGSGLIYVPSSSADFQNPELRPYLDKYLRGSMGYTGEQRVKVMKLLWDCIGTEFAGRHELYEMNYSGAPEATKVIALEQANSTGVTSRMKALVDKCLSEYDLNGWTTPDLIDPSDLSFRSRPR
ncbi:MAG TPA: 4-hydroxyphenylacetate 3-hydroxylase N-terminal domain-containing protein [Myxococcaceae bacterium]|jgi:4-hydroxyphenylacetate 3-monooxygenase